MNTFSKGFVPLGVLLLAVFSAALAQAPHPAGVLAGTEPLATPGDLAEQMVAGIDRYLTRLLEASEGQRTQVTRQPGWPGGSSNDGARQRFARLIGVELRPPRICKDLESTATLATPSVIAETDRYCVRPVRWPVLDGMDGEGLLLTPVGTPAAYVVALPDADWTPEMTVGLAPGLPPNAQFARRLAENGCLVLVPVLIDRRDEWSGNPKLGMTAQTHREYIYRMAYEMGRHVIGYEVQKVMAAIDWFEHVNAGSSEPTVGIVGYGEGGLLALHAAAIDIRVKAVVVSGYFESRQQVWSEPIYRNVWRLLTEFGDAELAGMVAPRHLIVEATRGPQVDGPPPRVSGRRPGSPGVLRSPPMASVRHEFDRAAAHYEQRRLPDNLRLIVPEEADPGPGCEQALTAFLAGLGRRGPVSPSGAPSVDLRGGYDPKPRLKRQFDQLCRFTQDLVPRVEAARHEALVKLDLTSIEKLEKANGPRRDYFWTEVIGRCEDTGSSTAVRSRLWRREAKWTGYEVVLDIGPELFAYGMLLVPNDLAPGERRPVVVCQHGLEGRPSDVCDPNVKSVYHAFGAKLADLGYVVYAPQNPYIGDVKFRTLQRKANPLGRSLFSVIVCQHQRTLDWLSSLSCVDAKRIAFYGLSYGGKTAMRVPAILPQYCLSICSGDFNEWVRKNVSTDYPGSYMVTDQFEMPEFALAERFNYAEMATLIAPRPFMVERGHNDGVGVDEWVAYEYAKVGRFYALLGIPDRAEIEYFNGPHEIHGVGTFAFLKKHLGWPR